MLVSIIIPVYNGETFFRKCLDSIVNQVYKNIEIIIIDDASSDNTKDIIKEYANKDKRIIPFYSKLNKGVSNARNIGLKAASGDYIIFVDSDDELVPSAIRRLVDLAEKNESDFVDSFHLLYYTKKNGNVVSFTEKKLPKKTIISTNIEDDPKILNLCTYITGKLIKKDLIKDLFFDESLRRYEDLVFEYKLKQRIKKYVLLNRPIYIYYQRSDSLVNSFGEKHACYLDAVKITMSDYKDKSKNVKNSLEALFFNNGLFTGIAKVAKNDLSLDDNVRILREYLNKMVDIFPNYISNKEISNFTKKNFNKLLVNDKFTKNIVKRINKLNIIDIYFIFLSKKNKYEIKNYINS